MALNIPNVGTNLDALMGGIKTGSGMFANLMHPILEREKQKQAEAHFQEQLKLSKAAAARNASLMPYRLQELQDKHAAAQFDRNMMSQLMDGESSGGDKDGGMGGGSMPGMPAPQIPTEVTGQGLGVFTPEGLQQAQQALSAPKSAAPAGNSALINKLMKDPVMRGWFNHKFGYDPLAPTAQTPEEKQAMALDLFKQKEAIKKGANGENVPLTTAMKTKLQGVVTGVDNSLPVIQDLVNHFKNLPTGSETFNPSAYAAYNAKANAIIEPLINAFGLNVTDATKEMMHEQVFRKTNETLVKYRNRLVDLAKEIIRRRDDSFASLKSGTIDPKSQFTNEFFEGLKGETKEINGKKYQKLNGEWHEVE